MAERIVCPDYELRGLEYELWLIGDSQWALGDPRDNRMKIESDFDPPLTDAEIDRLNQYVYDYLSDQ